VIQCNGISKVFRRHTGQRLICQHISDWFRRSDIEKFYALKNVSFRVAEGESVGVIGHNGAGKSTLLSIVTGLARPDEGSIQVNGRIAALLELGSGFHPDLTGAENVRLNAALLGFTRRETAALFDSIVEFSGVGDFINEPLRTYSSGMVMRLAFSIATNVEPDVLVIDEILAVGDQTFQAKCHDRISQLRRAGKTFLCVSHSRQMILELCDRVLWLDRGELIMDGSAVEVLDAYAGSALPHVESSHSE
jgi:ABC-type polysaccharide/polyol phosphate transport system ATPase subunit